MVLLSIIFVQNCSLIAQADENTTLESYTITDSKFKSWGMVKLDSLDIDGKCELKVSGNTDTWKDTLKITFKHQKSIFTRRKCFFQDIF